MVDFVNQMYFLLAYFKTCFKILINEMAQFYMIKDMLNYEKKDCSTFDQ